MFNYIKNWFSSKKRYEPKIGEVYKLKQTNVSPFNRIDVFVTIKDVKEGWVLYAMHPLEKSMWQNESMPIKTFLAIYRKIEKETT